MSKKLREQIMSLKQDIEFFENLHLNRDVNTTEYVQTIIKLHKRKSELIEKLKYKIEKKN